MPASFKWNAETPARKRRFELFVVSTIPYLQHRDVHSPHVSKAHRHGECRQIKNPVAIAPGSDINPLLECGPLTLH